jgi:20S proteasome alpha/beta subunit
VTLIIGIKCRDGIAVGADGAATLGTIAENTVQQPVRKLFGVDDELIVGVSGPVAFSQIYSAEIRRLSKAQFLKRPEKVLSAIRDAVWGNLEKEWKAASTTSGVLGQAALSSVMSSAVVAMPILDEPSLFQFNHQCTFEEATSDLPFVAIGSGQKLADPFLAFLRRIFWPAKLPHLSDGILATLWTLQQAIRTNAGGVSDPIQIMTLSKIKSRWTAVELTDEDLAEHKQNISDAERALANYKVEQTTATPVEIPTPGS